MKILVFFLLASTAHAGLFGNSFLQNPVDRPKVPLCKDNKPNHNYSLTIYAYSETEKGVPLDEASQQLEDLASSYDWFAQGVMLRLLLRTEGFEKESNNNNGYAIENYYLTTKINHDVVNELKPMGAALSSPIGMFSKIAFVPTSNKGDELVICPKKLCDGLTIPQINKTIERHQRDHQRPNKDIYTVKENPFDEFGSIDEYNSIKNDKITGQAHTEPNYFLYDILSKSGFSLASTLGQNYYMIPEMEQGKICNDVKKELPTLPGQGSGCFKYNINDKERIKDQKFGNRFGRSLSVETQQLAYMDSVARDYAEQTVFSFEKKNEGKWIIYKIKTNPEFICKYGRPISEFTIK